MIKNFGFDVEKCVENKSRHASPIVSYRIALYANQAKRDFKSYGRPLRRAAKHE